MNRRAFRFGAFALLGILLGWSYDRSPGDLDPPLVFQKYDIRTPSGVRLASWHVKAPGVPQGTRRPAVLVMPGDTEALDERLDVVEGFARRGYDVFSYDPRGRGQSDPFAPDPKAFVSPQHLEDAHSGLDILWAQDDVDTTRIAVYGEGMGAYIAFALVRERPEVRALVSVSCPYNFEKLREVETRQGADSGLVLPEGWKRKQEPDKVLSRFEGAILFIGGDRDLTTPAWMAEDLHEEYDLAKELWIVAGASREYDKAPRNVAGAAYYDRIVAFLDRELAKPLRRGWPK